MKSNFKVVSRSQQERDARRAAVEEIERQKKHICPDCAMNLQYQIMATLLWVMHRQFGFGTTRLNRLKDAVEREFALMETGILGKEYKATMLYKSLAEIGVDLEGSVYD